MAIGQTPAPLQYRVAVERESLCAKTYKAVLSRRDGREGPVESSQTSPLPLTNGTIEKFLHCLRSAPDHLILAIQVTDMNFCHFFSSGKVQDLDDEPLQRLWKGIQEIERGGGRAPYQLEHLGFYDRLSIRATRTAANSRVVAATKGHLFFYPCPHPKNKDCWEVRYMDSTNPEVYHNTYERFLDWEEAEVLRYIDVAVKLGNAKRLTPQRLASEDPVMFWQICFRYAACFPRLAQEAGAEWMDLKQGLKQAEASGHGALGFPNFGREMEEEVLRGGEEVRAKLSLLAGVYALSSCMAAKPKGIKIVMDVDSELNDEPFGKQIAGMKARTSAALTLDSKDQIRDALMRASRANAPASAAGSAAVPGKNVAEKCSRAACSKYALLDKAASAEAMLRQFPGAEFVEKLLRCPCRQVSYCGPACQKAHWKEHKNGCSAKKGAAAK